MPRRSRIRFPILRRTPEAPKRCRTSANPRLRRIAHPPPDSRGTAEHRHPTDTKLDLRAQRRPRIGCRWDDRGREQIGDGNPIPVVSWIDSRSSNPYSALVRPLSGIGSPCLDVRLTNRVHPIEMNQYAWVLVFPSVLVAIGLVALLRLRSREQSSDMPAPIAHGLSFRIGQCYRVIRAFDSWVDSFHCGELIRHISAGYSHYDGLTHFIFVDADGYSRDWCVHDSDDLALPASAVETCEPHFYQKSPPMNVVRGRVHSSAELDATAFNKP